MEKKSNNVLFLRKILLRMKLTLLTTIIFAMQLSASVIVHGQKLTLQIQNETLRDVLREIEKQSPYRFFYNDAFADLNRTIQINLVDKTINETMNALLNSSDMSYKIMDNNLVVIAPKRELQQRIVTGRITDDNTGEALPGANVVIKGTTTGTIAGANGEYSLEVAGPDVILVYSFIGYTSQEITVGTRTSIDVALALDLRALDEVVVIGYGSVKRSDLTGSVGRVESSVITSTMITSPAEALKGRVAGVDVTSAHNPGAAPKILIRGKNSITGDNEPLWVVNGIPIIGSNIDLNPADIESIDILKDASATAIYGSRGSNGVIIVTTKKAEKGVTFSYDGYSGIQQIANRLDMLDGSQHAEFRREAHRASTAGYTNDEAIFDIVELESIQQGISTDWIDLTLSHTGWQQSHNITANVAGENSSSSASFGYFKNQSVLGPKVNFERFNFKLNSELRVSERFQIGASALLSNSLQNDYSESVRSFMVLTPLGVPYDDEGNLQLYVTPTESLNTNPLLEIENNDIQNKAFRIIGNMYAKLKITKDLSYQAIFGNDVRFTRNGEFEGSITRIRGGAAARSSFQNFTTSSYIFDHILNYNKQLNDHNIDITAVMDVQKFREESIYLQATDADYDGLWYNLGAAATVADKNSNLIEWALLSYMGRLNYNFKNKYYVTFTSRYDGSSRLSEGNKWALFPSAAVAWRLSSEEFMQNDVLDNLKLRASWGKTGNSSVAPYETLGTLSRVLYNYGSKGVYGYVPTGIPNKDLKWETTTEVNLGIDWGVLKNRIGGSIELYNRLTSDLILARSLPITSGYTSVTQNIGSVRNKGIEAILSAYPIVSQDFRMNITLNFSKNINEIVDLYGDKQDDIGNNWFIGYPIDCYYDYDFIGVWQSDEAAAAAAAGKEPGWPKLFSNAEDGTLDPDRDRVIIPSVPSWIGGLNMNMEYKDFDFSMHMYTRQGERRYSETHANIDWTGNRAQLDVNYWRPDNPSNEYPRPRVGLWGTGGAGDLYIRDLSFVRLANVSLGYNVNKRILGSVFERLRLYTSVQNPITWTKFDGWDPEESTLREAHAPMRTYLFGVNASF